MSALLEGLNSQQKEAVQQISGALLVVAGAGTGKTRVITRRIAYLIQQGIPAHHILAITFTNKAASEMKERVEKLVGLTSATLTTYHSFCARFLRRHSDKIGYTSDYSIYDRDESLAVMKKALKELGKTDVFTPSTVLDVISSFKQEMASPAQAASQALNSRDREIAALYQSYELRLRQSNALDFDDLLVRTVQLLQSDSELLKATREQYAYLLVDEYQDTNYVQYQIVKLIASHGNLCVTGDPDQSIYTWRGADIRNILEFENDFPKAKIILLEENYRSTGHILKAASSVIANNKERKDRGLWTEASEGDLIALTVLQNEKEEAKEVAETIQQARTEGIALKDQAVFYRTNAQTRILERVFREMNIPYRLVGAVSFFKRKEVKDILAYIGLWLNAKDDQFFLRIVNTPRRGLGNNSLLKLSEYAQRQSLSLFEALMDVEKVGGLTKRALSSFITFRQIFVELGKASESGVRDSLVKTIELTDYENFLKKEANANERIDNIRELVSAARDFELAKPGEGVSEFLSDISLLTSTELEEGDMNGVTMMTLHGAKGLEFDHVHFVGLEEELMPHSRSLHDPKALEEERRLMYVGITRARKKLHLYRAVDRNLWGDFKTMLASRFLTEIPEHLLQVKDKSEDEFSEYLSDAPSIDSDFVSWQEEEYSQLDEFEEAPVKVGDRVEHQKFGGGQILSVSGRMPALKVRVKFFSVGVRQLIWGKAPMEKVRENF